MQTIDCQVVMLSQNKEGWSRNDIVKMDSIIVFPLYDMDSNIDNWKAQHLYFTSKEEIKEVDWTICNNKLYKVPKDAANCTSCRKIVASTDSSLGLPAIPESFLKQYVAANGKIDKVQLKQYLTGAPPKPKLYTTDNNEVVIVDEPNQ